MWLATLSAISDGSRFMFLECACSCPTLPCIARSSTAIPASAPAAPVMAAARAVSIPAVSAIEAAAAEAAAAVIEEDEDEDGGAKTRKTATLRRVASTALRHLAPVSKAQAAPALHVKTAANEGWSIQLGAYRDQSAARQALRQVAGASVVNGKPQQVLAPPKSDRRGLYRVRLLSFSEKGARTACVALKKRKIECTVIRSATPAPRPACGR